MSRLYTREQIHEGVLIDLAETLSCEIDDLKPEATFFNDLGGESIDLLDFSFSTRRRFGIEASFRELLEAWEVDPNGCISRNTIQRLEHSFPRIQWADRISSLNPSSPRDLLTVGLIEDILFHSQSANVDASTAAGQQRPDDTDHPASNDRMNAADRFTLPKPTE